MGELFAQLKQTQYICRNKVKRDMKQIWFNARTTLPEDDGSEILCLEEGGYARLSRGKILTGTTKWAYVKELAKIDFLQDD